MRWERLGVLRAGPYKEPHIARHRLRILVPERLPPTRLLPVPKLCDFSPRPTEKWGTISGQQLLPPYNSEVPMHRLSVAALVLLVALGVLLLTGFGTEQAFWSQWGQDAQHQGLVSIAGQQINNILADIIYDPFVPQEQAESGGELLAHYQSTLIDGNSFYMVQKSGHYPSCEPVELWVYGFPCGPNAWNRIQWNVVRRDWQGSTPVVIWTYPTDWKPEPNATNFLLGYGGLEGWEPVFHPALANGFLYVPGAAGTVWKVNTATGQTQTHINPVSGGGITAANTFVSGPLTADANGNIYYNVIELNINGNPWGQNDVVNAWLVKITPGDAASTVTYAALVPNAPPAAPLARLPEIVLSCSSSKPYPVESAR